MFPLTEGSVISAVTSAALSAHLKQVWSQTERKQVKYSVTGTERNERRQNNPILWDSGRRHPQEETQLDHSFHLQQDSKTAGGWCIAKKSQDYMWWKDDTERVPIDKSGCFVYFEAQRLKCGRIRVRSTTKEEPLPVFTYRIQLIHMLTHQLVLRGQGQL